MSDTFDFSELYKTEENIEKLKKAYKELSVILKDMQTDENGTEPAGDSKADEPA